MYTLLLENSLDFDAFYFVLFNKIKINVLLLQHHATRQLKSRKKLNYLYKLVLACCFTAGAATISKNQVTCASKKSLARETKWRTQLKNSNDAICGVSFVFFFLFFF